MADNSPERDRTGKPAPEDDAAAEGIVFETDESEKPPTAAENQLLQPDKDAAREEIEHELAGSGIESESASRKKFTDSLVRPLRTFKGDLQNAMQKNKTSLTSIAAAEQERRAKRTPEEAETSGRRGIRPWLLGGSLVLVLAGAGTLAAVFFFSGTDDTPERFVKPTALFFVNDEIELATDDAAPRTLKQMLAQEVDAVDLSLGSVAEIYLTETDEAGTTRLLSAAAFFEALDASLRPAALRNLGTRYLFGVHVFDGNQPVLLVTVDSFEQVFAGMLEWEPVMSEDLAPIFGPAIAPVRQSTSTPPTPAPFEDAIIRNHDTRVLRDADGDIALLYAFPTRRTLIITTNEHTFAEALTRMANTRSRE